MLWNVVLRVPECRHKKMTNRPIVIDVSGMNPSHRSPRGSSIRIAQGPSPDGVWRKRQAPVSHILQTTSAANWCAEMKAQIEAKREQQMTVFHLLQHAVEAAAAATRLAATVIASLQPAEAVVAPMASFSPYPFPFPLPVPYYAYGSAPAPYEEIFTPEEIEIERAWIDPLVACPLSFLEKLS